jgi:hypothetical protein
MVLPFTFERLIVYDSKHSIFVALFSENLLVMFTSHFVIHFEILMMPESGSIYKTTYTH